jgi:hypothetical protein
MEFSFERVQFLVGGLAVLLIIVWLLTGRKSNALRFSGAFLALIWGLSGIYSGLGG